MTNNTRQTGKKAASAAGKTLGKASSTKAEKSAAASALAQTGPNSKGEQSGKKAASAAGKTLGKASSTKAEKSAAASTLAQTPSKKR